ncbi:phage minor capsid protein [Enterococcus entomosocium]|uniref:phage minor capsid protein n=1 Tax=Enterococcus entomosocium TaxID=3034352 RepID=UPI002647B1B2|nr:phage minor capsid protein [Enterococcus entomosocium]
MSKRQLTLKQKKLVEKTIAELDSAYSQHHKKVKAFLLKALFPNGTLAPQYSQDYVLSTLQEAARILETRVAGITERQLKEALLLGLLMYFEDIGSPISVAEAREILSLSASGTQLVSEVTRMLNHTPANTSARIERIVGQAYSQELLLQVADQRDNERLLELYMLTETEDEFAAALEEEGFVGIVDSAGRRWKPDVYAMMVLRTMLRESTVAMQKEQAKSDGFDLAWISDHNVDNPCNLWENTIISLNGIDSRFPTYEEAKATLEVFHPNCQHYLNVIRDLADVPAHVIAATESKYGIRLQA